MVGRDNRKRCDGQSLHPSKNYIHISMFWEPGLVSPDGQPHLRRTYVSNRGVLNFLPANKAPVLVNHLIPSK